MAPSPENDKEPKAPDKSVTNHTVDSNCVAHDGPSEIHNNVEVKLSNASLNPDAEDNTDVDTLDDGQLKALLDEAYTYKRPKDREGKSSLFKELLEEVEQDEQACEAAVAAAGGVRHSNSLQELVAALAAEPAAAAAARRRDRLRAHHHAHHAPAAASSVSARAIHGGSLPSGVDTSFLLGEEPPRLTPTVGGYVATVRCVNPPPLGERRVSTSDAHPQFSQEQPEITNANRRSCMAAFPMTYTARATLEIGTAAAGPGRAVTTTTASNQVRTPPPPSSARALRARTLPPRGPDHYRPSAPLASHPPPPPPDRPPPDPAAAAAAAATATATAKKKKKKKSVQTLENSQTIKSKEHDQKNSPKEVHDKAEGANDKNRKDKTASKDKVPAAADILLQSLQKPLNERGDTKGSKESKNTNVTPSANRATKNKPKVEQTKANPINDPKKRHQKGSGDAQKLPSQLSEEEPIMWYSQTKVSYSNIAYSSQSPSEGYMPRNYQTFADLPRPENVTSGPPEHIFQKRNRQISKYQIQAMKQNNDTFYKNYQSNSAYKKSYPLVSDRNNDDDNDFLIASKHSLDNNNLSDTGSARRGHISNTHDNTNSDEYYHRMINTKNLKLFSLSALNPENVRPTTIFIPPPLPRPNADTDHENETVKTVCGNKPQNDYKSYRGGDDKYATMVESGGNTSPIMTSDNELTHSERVEVGSEFINALDDDKDGTGDNLIDKTTHSNHLDSETQFADDVEREVTSLTYQKFVKNVPNKIDCDIKNEISTKLCSNNTNLCSSNKIKCDIELTNIDSDRPHASKADSGEYFIKQAKLLNALKSGEQNSVDSDDFEQNMMQAKATPNSNDLQSLSDSIECERTSTPKNLDNEHEVSETISNEINSKEEMANIKPSVAQEGCEFELIDACTELQTVTDANREKVFENVAGEQYIVAELSNNTYVFLTLPKRLLLSDSTHPDGNRSLVLQSENNIYQANLQPDTVDDVDNNNLRMLRLENVSKSGMNAVKPSNSTNKVDSGIPFSCITTPEVVTSCHTTPSSPHSSIAVDAKARGAALAAGAVRPAASALAALDDYKKSMDENGNSLQGITSSIISSSQHKKPRRKKTTSRNETVIKSHQIDGYQGNKDIDEVLRFIESNAERGRGGKLPRTKHDADDKGKKRSAERRAKDKEHRKRANSMEELSRTNIDDLTDRPEGDATRRAKDAAPVASPAERRSWGDDNRDTYYFEEASPPPPQPVAPTPAKIEKKKVKASKSVDAPGPGPTPLEQITDVTAELLDFQTVTKKKKQRKRAEERAPRAASPERRRKSAPPSDKSNDSNDDLDSVHSLPGEHSGSHTAPRPLASYADIARTRHNIPDLIESCNYYPEAEAPPPPPAPLYDADGYPALSARARKPTAPPAASAPCPCPSPPDVDAAPPDVVAARRPPVILAAEGGGGGDMEGVTFGFDVNEQLLDDAGTTGVTEVTDVTVPAEAEDGGCDLVASAARAVLVARGLRYLPPPPAAAHPDLLHYVANAWEDILKCSGTKVRYFSE